jgi:hypothetical protein
MKAILLIAAGITLTVSCWGMYGPVLHRGQEGLGGNKLKPLICVGLAYFIVAIILPTAILIAQGQFKGGWSGSGITWSMMAGVAGALGAMGIILALTSGGRAIYVMPLVFGGAPVINTFLSMYWSKAWQQGINPIFYVGLLLVIVGAATVLTYAPRPAKAGHGKAAEKAAAMPEIPAAEGQAV